MALPGSRPSRPNPPLPPRSVEQDQRAPRSDRIRRKGCGPAIAIDANKVPNASTAADPESTEHVDPITQSGLAAKVERKGSVPRGRRLLLSKSWTRVCPGKFRR